MPVYHTQWGSDIDKPVAKITGGTGHPHAYHPTIPDPFGKAQQASSGFSRETNPNEVAKFAYKLWGATHRGDSGRINWRG